MTRTLDPDRLETQLSDKKPLYTEAEAKAEAERCLYCADAPCIAACPTAIDIPTFIKKIASGNVRGSARTILEQNLLGWSCGRVCPVEVLCGGACVYHTWGREPIAIGRLQRYAVELAVTGARPLLAPRSPPRPRRAACVGAGPASLAFAGTLALAGHSATVFERGALPGGLNTTGIAPYKLHAHDALDEVAFIESLGVEIRAGVEVVPAASAEEAGALSLPKLLEAFDAVFVGIGLGADATLGVPGEDGPGVHGATAFIERMKLGRAEAVRGKRVVVIGGGNTAIDVARECALLGASDVAMAYRRGLDAMSAYGHELVAGRVEGVRVITHAQPVAFVRDDRGALVAVRFIATAEGGGVVSGAEREVPCDLAAIAIGQSKLRDLVRGVPGVELDERGTIVVDGAIRVTGHPKLFAGGDCINGGQEVVNAVADGRDAARALIARWERAAETTMEQR